MSYIQEIINLMIMRIGWLAVFTSSEHTCRLKGLICVLSKMLLSNTALIRR